MLNAIGMGVTSAIGYVGTVLGAIAHESGQLRYVLPVVGLTIGMGVIGFAIAKIKSLVWGM